MALLLALEWTFVRVRRAAHHHFHPKELLSLTEKITITVNLQRKNFCSAKKKIKI